MTARFTFRLKPERDNDLIDWLNSLGEGERSFFIRQALRQALKGKPEVPAFNPVFGRPETVPPVPADFPTGPAVSEVVTSDILADKLNNLAKLF